MHAPTDLLTCIVEPRWPHDRDRFRTALDALPAEATRVSLDPSTGRAVLSAVQEAALLATVTDLRRRLGEGLRVGDLSVICRERITRPAEGSFGVREQTPDGGRFAQVGLHVSPVDAGSDAGGAVPHCSPGLLPDSYRTAIAAGVASACRAGPLAGFPLGSLSVRVLDAAYHDRDSSPLAFETAGRMALYAAVKAAGPVVVEPVMRVTVTAPAEILGPVLHDLRQRRGAVLPAAEPDAPLVALVPLAELLGYVERLRALSGDRAHARLLFDHDAPIAGGTPPSFRPAAALRSAV